MSDEYDGVLDSSAERIWVCSCEIDSHTGGRLPSIDKPCPMHGGFPTKLCTCTDLPCTCYEWRDAFSKEEISKLSYHSARTFAKNLYDMGLLDIVSLKKALWFLSQSCNCSETIDDDGTILHSCQG